MSWLSDPVLANGLQWDGRTRGHYEAYTLNLVDPSNETGWWLRYSLDAPMQGEETSSLWGAHFAADGAPDRFALKTDFPIRSFGTMSDGFHIRVSKAELMREEAKGGLRNPQQDDHVLRWNVNMADPADPFRIYGKDGQYEGREPPTKVLVPTPRSHAGGVVEVGDQRYVVRGGRGMQSHRWGSARFDRWTTGYATFFRERPNAYLYAFLGETDADSWGGIRYRDEEGLDLSFGKVRTSTDEGPGREPGVWTFKAKTRGWELTGRFSASLQRMVGVRFEDPDGSVRYCHHGGLADATIELWKRSWGRKKLHQTLTAKGTCIFQQGGRRPYDDVEFFV